MAPSMAESLNLTPPSACDLGFFRVSQLKVDNSGQNIYTVCEISAISIKYTWNPSPKQVVGTCWNLIRQLFDPLDRKWLGLGKYPIVSGWDCVPLVGIISVNISHMPVVYQLVPYTIPVSKYLPLVHVPLVVSLKYLMRSVVDLCSNLARLGCQNLSSGCAEEQTNARSPW